MSLVRTIVTLLFIPLLLLLAVAASAQPGDDGAGRIGFGLRVGLNTTRLSSTAYNFEDPYTYYSQSGASATLFATLPLSYRQYSIARRSGLGYSLRGEIGYAESGGEVYDYGYYKDSASYLYRYDLAYLQLPLTLRLSYLPPTFVGMSIFGGFYGALLISSAAQVDRTPWWEWGSYRPPTTTTRLDVNARAFDAGTIFGVSFDFPIHKSTLELDIRITSGFGSPIDTLRFANNHAVSVSLGWAP